jgi:hypothetical protein
MPMSIQVMLMGSRQERRGQDCRGACLPLFVICSKRLLLNHFGTRRLPPHLTQISAKGNRARYKNATNSCATFVYRRRAEPGEREAGQWSGL